MPKTLDPPNKSRCVLIGSKMRKPLPPGVTACRNADLPEAVYHDPRRTVFISYRQTSTDDLLKASLHLQRGSRIGGLLTIEPPRAESLPSLIGIFNTVVGAGASYSWLPVEELMTALSGRDAANRFIGGAADPFSQTLALVRGNLATLAIPFSFFKESGDDTKPDFGKLSFTDYGLTVTLGGYEASADGILYEFDPAYRQKLNRERQKSERSFGASLRRLRLQRRLKRSDFAPLSSKTIARIERNEVDRPHGKSLEVIAKRLGVSPEQIESY